MANKPQSSNILNVDGPYSFRRFDYKSNDDLAQFTKFLKHLQFAKFNPEILRSRTFDFPFDLIKGEVTKETNFSYFIEAKTDGKTETIGFCLAFIKKTYLLTDLQKVRILSVDVIPEYDKKYMDIFKSCLTELTNYIKNSCTEIEEINIIVTHQQIIDFLLTIGFYKYEHMLYFYPNRASAFKLKFIIKRPKKQ